VRTAGRLEAAEERMRWECHAVPCCAAKWPHSLLGSDHSPDHRRGTGIIRRGHALARAEGHGL